MEIRNILEYALKPELYEKGTAVMWTDNYISKQLLMLHLSQDTDLASRKFSVIDSTIDWILSNTNNERMNVLDLGCGPGLYVEKFALKGHAVTGIDFSLNSIEYAKNEAARKNLSIYYRHQNYLELDEKEKYDLIILIYTDFGVLIPDERDELLKRVFRALKPNGIFVFDVLNENNLRQKITQKTWELCPKGFWRDHPYLILSESFLYEDKNVILNQHTVIDNFKTDCYRFWNHVYTDNNIYEFMTKCDFRKISMYRNVLPGDDAWSGKNVTFCVAGK